MQRRWTHYAIALLVAFIIFGNHYTRDTPGALEKQLEKELHYSPHEYSLLNSMYFIPNIATPLLAGIFIKELGGIPRAFLLSCVVVSVGHFMFSLGVELESKPVMFVGKAVAGSMYEIIDALMPIIYLSPIFKDEFPLVVGVLNICLRSGSIVNFVLSPWVYSAYSLKTAFWLSAAIGCTAIPLFLLARYLEVGSLSMDERLHLQVAEQVDETDEESSSTKPPPTDGHTPVTSNRIFPPDGYGIAFYLYSIAGACLYGGIVPFWFFGSKYLQDTFGMSVTTADRILTVPELMVVVVGVPMGFVLSYCNLSLHAKLRMMSAFMLVMAVAYCALLWLGLHFRMPLEEAQMENYKTHQLWLVVASVLVMGTGFSVACNIFWSLVNRMVEEAYLSPATGFVSCAVNVLPTLVPPVITWLALYAHQHACLFVMIALVVAGTVACVACYVAVLGKADTEAPLAVQATQAAPGSHYEMVPVLEPEDAAVTRGRSASHPHIQ